MPELAVASPLAQLSPTVSFKNRNHLVNLLRHVFFSDRPRLAGRFAAGQASTPARRIEPR
jgi:hypothetical protein